MSIFKTLNGYDLQGDRYLSYRMLQKDTHPEYNEDAISHCKEHHFCSWKCLFAYISLQDREHVVFAAWPALHFDLNIKTGAEAFFKELRRQRDDG